MRHVVRRLFLASMVIAALSSCGGRRAERVGNDASPGGDDRVGHAASAKNDHAAKNDLSAEIERSEQLAAARDAQRECERPVAVYDGSIEVDSTEYLHAVARGEDFVDEPIDGLDGVLTRSTRVPFTLDYPFERPFDGVVTGEITLRRTIDAVRAGFRTMYEATTEREIPGLHNKEVSGPYGRAFHVIGDLVIEGIALCADGRFLITIGS